MKSIMTEKKVSDEVSTVSLQILKNIMENNILHSKSNNYIKKVGHL